MTDTANAPERIWMTAEDRGASWPGAFRAFRCSDLDHSNDDGPNPDYPEYVLATHCDELVAAERAKLAAIVAAQESVIKAWPRVRLILQEYDNAFPYAELEGDDEAVCALERAIRALAPDNSRAALQENADE